MLIAVLRIGYYLQVKCECSFNHNCQSEFDWSGSKPLDRWNDGDEPRRRKVSQKGEVD